MYIKDDGKMSWVRWIRQRKKVYLHNCFLFILQRIIFTIFWITFRLLPPRLFPPFLTTIQVFSKMIGVRTHFKWKILHFNFIREREKIFVSLLFNLLSFSFCQSWACECLEFYGEKFTAPISIHDLEWFHFPSSQ